MVVLPLPLGRLSKPSTMTASASALLARLRTASTSNPPKNSHCLRAGSPSKQRYDAG